MIIERDRYYWTRNGRMRRIVCTDGAGDHPVIDEYGWHYSASGQFDKDITMADSDLVRPVCEAGQWWRIKKTGIVFKLIDYNTQRGWKTMDNDLTKTDPFHSTVEEKCIIEDCEFIAPPGALQEEIDKKTSTDLRARVNELEKQVSVLEEACAERKAKITELEKKIRMAVINLSKE
jgi:hypothetical protein